jgi:ubiquinone/menaquinone biosynthesis C-methylase UbiE
MATGHRVLGVERSATLVRAARAGSPSVTVLRADAAAVPLRDGAATLVVACMVLHDVDDLAAEAGEVARVLRPAATSA